MPESFLPQFLRSLHRAIGPGEGADLTDADLLRRFLDRKDPAAFEVLVWRHAALVLAACRRVLPRPADAEDAFQATFLVLLYKAGSIGKRQSLASWLYRVAFRTALRVQRSAARRAAHERRAVTPAASEFPPPEVAAEVRPTLDEELSRLPEKYRAPLVLHYLQGLSKEETARQLGCPAGTVSSRLHRGQELLRRRLTRRGVTLTAAGLGALVASQPILAGAASDRIHSLVRVAAGDTLQSAGVGVPVATLAREVLRPMRLARLGALVACVLLAGMTAAVAAGIVRGRFLDGVPGAAAEAGQPGPEEPVAPAKKAAEHFPNPPGYVWALSPQASGRAEYGNGTDVRLTVGAGRDGSLVVTVTHPPRYSRAGRPCYRPVAFDGEERRHLFTFSAGSMNARQAENRYVLPTRQLPAEKVRYLAVEELPPEGRKIAAAHAARLAADKGVKTLPLPEPGKPFAFELAGEDGRPVTGRELLGKVVAIHCWADWHPDSLAGRAKLLDLRRRGKEGFEVVGIDLGHDSEKDAPAGLRATVRVPRDLASRELWEQASEVFALPRLFLLDRHGVLRFDTPADPEGAIAELLREP
jgi:RNA polymerase sigma factor (sigma-70 family)